RLFLGIESIMHVVVSADDDVEVRKVTLLNRTRRRRFLEITSFAELALAPHGADAGHSTFSKIFVVTEVEDGVIVAHRRPRSPGDAPLWVAHMLVGPLGNIECETDRHTFYGRDRTIVDAEALSRSLNGSAGALLD